MFDRLRNEYGFRGSYAIVKDYVREHRRGRLEMFVPLVHPPGHAQADFGKSRAVIGGALPGAIAQGEMPVAGLVILLYRWRTRRGAGGG